MYYLLMLCQCGGTSHMVTNKMINKVHPLTYRTKIKTKKQDNKTGAADEMLLNTSQM